MTPDQQPDGDSQVDSERQWNFRRIIPNISLIVIGLAILLISSSRVDLQTGETISLVDLSIARYYDRIGNIAIWIIVLGILPTSFTTSRKRWIIGLALILFGILLPSTLYMITAVLFGWAILAITERNTVARLIFAIVYTLIALLGPLLYPHSYFFAPDDIEQIEIDGKSYIEVIEEGWLENNEYGREISVYECKYSRLSCTLVDEQTVITGLRGYE